MLELTKTLLESKSAPEVMAILINSGLSSLEAAQMVCKALETPNKIKMQKIVILWSEGLVDEDVEFTSWKEFNTLLREIAQEHDKDGYTGAYAKTKFHLTWTDGEVYEGRLDVNTKEDTNVGQHILDHLRFYAGQWKPAHLTEKAYQACIKDENQQDFIDYMNKYDIEV